MQGTEQQAQVDIRRHYPVSPEKVWRAWTDPQALIKWFGPAKTNSPAKAEIDLRVGGAYSISFNSPDGEANKVSGIYEEVAPYDRLVFSWSFQSTPERVSRITIALTPMDGGTELHFVHDRFFDDKARANHERGWQEFFVQLDDFVNS